VFCNLKERAWSSTSSQITNCREAVVEWHKFMRLALCTSFMGKHVKNLFTVLWDVMSCRQVSSTNISEEIGSSILYPEAEGSKYLQNVHNSVLNYRLSHLIILIFTTVRTSGFISHLFFIIQ
jgi:hypothetical protein